RGRDFQNRAIEAVLATPGVTAATLSKDSPLHVSFARTVLLEGQGNAVSGKGRGTLTGGVGPGYFRAMGIPLPRGRDFSTLDTPTGPRVAIVNEVAARHFWPGQDAIGQRIRFAGDPTPLDVIAVVRSANYQAIGESPQALMYLSLTQYYFPSTVL